METIWKPWLLGNAFYHYLSFIALFIFFSWWWACGWFRQEQWKSFTETIFCRQDFRRSQSDGKRKLHWTETRTKLKQFGQSTKLRRPAFPKRNTRDSVELSDCDTKGGCGCGLEEHYRATISHRELCYVKVFLIMQAVWATGPDSHCAGREQPIKKKNSKWF